MQSWMNACLVTSSNSSSWSPLWSPSYSNEKCVTCKKVPPENTTKFFIIIRTLVFFKVYVKTLLSNRMLKQAFLFRDSEAEESHWKSGILSTEFEVKTERGCCRVLDIATIQRPKQLSSTQKTKKIEKTTCKRISV